MRHNPQSRYAASHRNRDFGCMNGLPLRELVESSRTCGMFMTSDRAGRPAIARRRFVLNRRSNPFHRTRAQAALALEGRPPARVSRLLAAPKGRAPCFQVARPQLWNCRKREPRRQPSVRKTHLACRRHSVCHRPPVCQDRPRMATLFPTKDLRGVPASSDAIQKGKTRRLFRRRIGRGYQPRPRTMGHCLAARFAGLPAAPTEGTLPNLSVRITRQITPSTGYHPGGSRSSRISRNLHPVSHVARG